jgi:exosome complex component RRP42
MHEEIKHTIHSLLAKGTRLDGRAPLDYREVSIEYDVAHNAEGSARVRIGETEVIAGVKMEIMKPYPDTADQGSLMVNVELLPLSSPEFEGGPPSGDAIELARVTDRGIRESKMIDLKKLCITPGEKAWMIIIDICTVNDAGNLFDAVALAALAALKAAKFPGFDGENIDYHVKTDAGVPLKSLPVTMTIYKYGKTLMLDPTQEEEFAYDSRLTVTVMEDGDLASMQKGGDEAFTLDDLSEILDVAIEKTRLLRSAL